MTDDENIEPIEPIANSAGSIGPEIPTWLQIKFGPRFATTVAMQEANGIETWTVLFSDSTEETFTYP